MTSAEARQHRRDALARAIEDVCTTFARHKLTAPVVGCSHCTSVEDDRTLRSNPLRRLSPADLQRFARKAMTTLGSVDDFKHFLPRLLEIASRDGAVGDTEIEIVFGKLHYGKWQSWSQAERKAIRAFFAAFWIDTLESESPRVDDILCAIGKAEDDLSPYLQTWRENESPAALVHLADYVDDSFSRLANGRMLRDAFWGGRLAQMRQVVDWMIDPTTTSSLEQAFDRVADPTLAERVSQTVNQIEWLRVALKY